VAHIPINAASVDNKLFFFTGSSPLLVLLLPGFPSTPATVLGAGRRYVQKGATLADNFEFQAEILRK
jgi:hypothetical protein